MKARDVMTKPMVLCSEDASVRQVAQMMADHNVGTIAVCDSQQKLKGIVTDRDICCRLVARGSKGDTPVSKIMSKEVECVSADDDLAAVELLMRSRKVRRVPVVDPDKQVKGMISLSDIAHHCKGSQQEHEFMEVFDTICTP